MGLEFMDRDRYVIDLMTPSPVVVGSDTPAWRAACLAEERGVHHLLVVEGYHLVGEVCACDLLRAGTNDPVARHHHSPAITVDDQATALAALHTMQRRRVGCLPVVDWTGALQGVLTRRDLRRAGLLRDKAERRCSTCGSTHGLSASRGRGSPFCLLCLAQGAMARSAIDALYLTSGDGD